MNKLSRTFNTGSLLLFSLPTVIMMIFTSIYTMVDGIFVSRLIGTDALSAVNIVYPMASVLLAVGVMFATGASAIIARKMGEGKTREAKQDFTFIVCFGFAVGVGLMILGTVFLDPLLRLMGADNHLFGMCRDYAQMMLWFTAPAMLSYMFQTFFVAAGRPLFGMAVIFSGGLTNMVLDYVFIGPMNMGVAGAALATGIGQTLPAVIGLLFFALGRRQTLCLIRPAHSRRMILDTCVNGSSEMVTNLAAAVVTLLFNVVMMKYAGSDGVAAITIVLYSQFLLTAVFLGYSSGIAPVISYKYGNEDTLQLKKIFRISMGFVGITSLVMFLASMLFAPVIVGIFTSKSSPVFAMTVHGFYLFAACYLFMGFNIFASSMFTALSNGKVSAAISFLRTFAFVIPCIMLLPEWVGINGVWISVPVAELLALGVSLFFFVKQRQNYHYA